MPPHALQVCHFSSFTPSTSFHQQHRSPSAPPGHSYSIHPIHPIHHSHLIDSIHPIHPDHPIHTDDPIHHSLPDHPIHPILPTVTPSISLSPPHSPHSPHPPCPSTCHDRIIANRKFLLQKLITRTLWRYKVGRIHRKLQKQRRYLAALQDCKRERRRGANIRNSYPRLDYANSTWARQMVHPNIHRPYTKEGASFRRRFRIPFPLFQRLVNIVQNEKWDGIICSPLNRAGKQSAPLHLKILAWLRVLGRGECFDSCSELTGISQETLRVFFHKFSAAFVNRFYSTYVHSPCEGHDLDRVLSEYKDVGFPGCVGSVDCVHVQLDKCPATER